jgi:hypothetical protein
VSTDAIRPERPDVNEIREAARYVADAFDGEPAGELAEIYLESTEETSS